jgi:hypothetical protein
MPTAEGAISTQNARGLPFRHIGQSVTSLWPSPDHWPKIGQVDTALSVLLDEQPFRPAASKNMAGERLPSDSRGSESRRPMINR